MKLIVTTALILGCIGCASPREGRLESPDGVFSAPRHEVLEQLDSGSVLLVVRWEHSGRTQQIIEHPDGLREVRNWLQTNLPEALPPENTIGAVMPHWVLVVAERTMTHAEEFARISLYGILSRSGSERLLTDYQIDTFRLLLEEWAQPYQTPVIGRLQNKSVVQSR